MAVTARPNLLSALVTRLRSIPEIADLVSSSAGWTDGSTEPRISSIMQDKWAMPTRAIRLRRAGGPVVGEDFSLGLWTARVDVVCYGARGHEAAQLVDLVLPALCPLQGAGAGFTARGCVVAWVRPEADVVADVEPQTGYPFAWVPIVAQFRGIAA